MSRNGTRRETVRAVEHPLQHTPANHALREQLARAYLFLNQSDAAIAEYQRLLGAGYQPASTYNNLGIVYAYAHEFQKAFACFQQARALAPDDQEIRQNYEWIVNRTPAQSTRQSSQIVAKTLDSLKGDTRMIEMKELRWKGL